MRRTARIAVIGAGLGGMTVAGLLQRAGFTVNVYEQTSAFSRIGAGIHLTSNVMLVMRRLGIEQTLADIGLHPDAFVSRQWDTGEILLELPFDAASEARYGAAYINVHRGDLHAVLATALAPGTIAFGRKLRDLDASGPSIRLAFDADQDGCHARYGGLCGIKLERRGQGRASGGVECGCRLVRASGRRARSLGRGYEDREQAAGESALNGHRQVELSLAFAVDEGAWRVRAFAFEQAQQRVIVSIEERREAW